MWWSVGTIVVKLFLYLPIACAIRNMPKIITVKKPPGKKLIIRVKRPLKTPKFPPYMPSLMYRRKHEPVQLQQPHSRMNFSEVYAGKDVKYLAVVSCHGAARDLCDPAIPHCTDPLFETEYDVIFTCAFGETTSTFGTSHEVCQRLCTNIG